MADPGFPRGVGANPPEWVPTYDLAKFSQKLYEIERIWTGGRGAHPKFYYRSRTVNSNTVNSKFHLIQSFFEILARILSFHV